MIICEICNRECKNIRSYSSHKWKAHSDEGKAQKPMLGKRHSDDTKKLLVVSSTGRTLSADARKKVSENNRRRTQTPATRQKLSKIMKDRHVNGTAHNIGQNRWNNKPSWPEQWFMNVVENEFVDKNYIREYPFYKYSLDFIWIHKRKVIEIDGEQHDRFPEQKARDLEKDRLLEQDGYQLMRVKWKEVYHNTQYWKEKIKNFIET